MNIDVVLWVIFIVWLVSLLHPSQEMRRDSTGNVVYYSIWAIVFVCMLVVQYTVMAQSGHAIIALESDLIGIGIYAFGVLLLWTLRRHWKEDEIPADSMPSSQVQHDQRQHLTVAAPHKYL